VDQGSENYRRFLAGEDAGMEAIITEYGQGLTFYLYKIVGVLEQAEELAEDTFVLLCTKKPRNKEKSSFKTWLYTIGRNLAIDHLRRQSRHKTLPIEESVGVEDGLDPESVYLRDAAKATLNRAMQTLKPEYQQVLWLVYFEGLSHKEIGQIMHKSIRATQMLANRAKQTLKTILIQEGIRYEDYQ